MGVRQILPATCTRQVKGLKSPRGWSACEYGAAIRPRSRGILMMRFFARLVMLLGVTTASGVATLCAQTPSTAMPIDAGYAELTFGPTFGHKASASVGGEAGYWLTERLGLFGEAGYMNNVATSAI